MENYHVLLVGVMTSPNFLQQSRLLIVTIRDHLPEQGRQPDLEDRVSIISQMAVAPMILKSPTYVLVIM